MSPGVLCQLHPPAPALIEAITLWVGGHIPRADFMLASRLLSEVCSQPGLQRASDDTVNIQN